MGRVSGSVGWPNERSLVRQIRVVGQVEVEDQLDPPVKRVR